MATRSYPTTLIHAAADQDELAPTGLRAAYPLRLRIAWTLAGLAVAVLIAGFWNAKTVDGFGREFVAGNTVGNTANLATSFGTNGLGFGIIFAAIAGLAATFTACNCVVFAMLPGLACTTDKAASRRLAFKALIRFASGVVAVGATYGVFVGTLGPDRVGAFNANRLPQAQLVFVTLGLLMLVWGAIEFGFLHGLMRHVPLATRAYFVSPLTRATIMGLMVGLFAVGRPFPVFRDLLTYAATSNNPAYGGLVMAIQGIGQITLMVVLFVLLVTVFGSRLTRWVTRAPQQPGLVTAVALVTGGMYFIYYWGIALAFDLGSWGFKLGIYH